MSFLSKVRANRKVLITYVSKDYVEQLRTVHFALLTVSAGLLLLILSVKPYDPQKAVLQLEAILRLKQLWTPDKLFANLPMGDSGTAVLGPEVFSFADSLSLQLTEAGHKPLLIPIEAPPPGDFIFEDNPMPFPDTLDHFSLWWKALKDKGFKFDLASELKIGGYCDALVYGPRCEIVYNARSSNRDVDKSEKVSIEPIISGGNLIGRVDARSARSLREGAFLPNGLRVLIPVLQHTTSVVKQEAALKAVSPDATPGDFATSFPDLYQATRSLLQYEELPDILKHLTAESSNAEVFEALGLKIPAEQVTSWGTVVILCIQLYLFVYLRGLKRPLQPSDEAWGVGWFAASESLLPRSIFFVTVWILPALTVILLARHALEQRFQLTPFRFNHGAGKISEFFAFAHDFPAVPFIILGCVLALALGYLDWFNRPRVETESEPSHSQLFE